MMNASADELAKFERLGAMWRDPVGPMRVLHEMNPLRTQWIADLARCHHQSASIVGLSVLDVGCGAGLLSESLTRLGAHVVGIDPVARNIRLAEAAATKAGQAIDYRVATPDILRDEGRRYEVVCALEVVEHVPDRPAFLNVLSTLVEPGGLLVISTINRTLQSWLVAIVGAERVFGVLPAGTHRWDWFICPPEAEAVLRQQGLVRLDLRGMWYAPLLHRVGWTRRTSVNWVGAWQRPGSDLASRRA